MQKEESINIRNGSKSDFCRGHISLHKFVEFITSCNKNDVIEFCNGKVGVKDEHGVVGSSNRQLEITLQILKNMNIVIRTSRKS